MRRTKTGPERDFFGQARLHGTRFEPPPSQCPEIPPLGSSPAHIPGQSPRIEVGSEPADDFHHAASNGGRPVDGSSRTPTASRGWLHRIAAWTCRCPIPRRSLAAAARLAPVVRTSSSTTIARFGSSRRRRASSRSTFQRADRRRLAATCCRSRRPAPIWSGPHRRESHGRTRPWITAATSIASSPV